MKKWVITGLVVLALVVAARSVHLWLPRLVPFLEQNSTLIQTLDSAIQIVLLVGAGLAFMFGIWRSRKNGEHAPARGNVTQSAEAGGVNVGGEVSVGGDIVGRDKLTTIIHQAPVPTPPSTALHQLPPPPSDFTGRTGELGELMKAVQERGATISGTLGMGGVGKTVLALKLAEQLTSRYPDAQFYLDLKGVSAQPLAPKDAMEHVIRAYRPDIKLPEKEAEVSGLYRSVLHNQRAILLMDSARDAQQVQPLIPPASCLLLITSRQHFTLPGFVAKNLDVLPPADARALLLKIAPRLAQDGEDHAGTLAKLCGYLPLALRTVGSALAARIDLRPADYVRKLADARERLKLTETEASLRLSYELLAAETQKQFCALAVFPDTFDLVAATAIWKVESDPAQEVLGQLLLYSLLEFNPASSRYRLHDLVRLFADARLNPGERAAAQRRHAGHYMIVAVAADKLYLQGGESLKKGLALLDAEWVNIQTGQAWAAAHASEDEAAAMLCSAYPDAGLYCLGLRQHPRERIRWLEAALAAARQLKNRGAEGAHLGNLGVAYRLLGEYRRAIESSEQHLEIARAIGDRLGEGNALGNLGNAYHALGEHRRAIEYHEQALAIFREIGDRLGEGQDLGNLGNAYHALGEYRRAIEYHEQALAISREIGDRLGEGTALGNLGNAYHALGEYCRAIEYYEQQLQIARKIEDRRGEGNSLGNLGIAYKSLGEYRRAIEYHEQSLAIFRKIGDRGGEGNALGNLGNAYDSLRDYRRAIEYHEQSLAISREIGDRRGEGNALRNMSLIFDKLGERAKAIAHAEASLKILEQIESPDVAKVRTKLATWRREG